MNRIFRLKSDGQWWPFIWLFILVLAFIVVIFIKSYSISKFEWEGVYFELFGLLFDIFFLGILFAIFEYRRSKRLEIKRYKEELEDYRQWKDEEASKRIVGVIKRLQNRGVNKVDLSYCYLNRAELWHTDVISEAVSANFDFSSMAGADFRDVDLSFSSFVRVHLYDSDFRGANIMGVDFRSANITNVDFRGCKNIEQAYFWSSLNIWTAKFDENVDIEKLKNQKRKDKGLGFRDEFFDKIIFFEKVFNCGVSKFNISEYNKDIIVVEFTKENFYNHKEMVENIRELEHYFIGHLNKNQFLNEFKNNR